MNAGQRRPGEAPVQSGNQHADERGQQKTADASGSEEKPQRQRPFADKPVVDDGGGRQELGKSESEAPHYSEKEINLPDFANLGHAQQTQRRDDIAQHNVFPGAETGDRDTRQRSQHAADDEKQRIRSGQGRAAPSERFAHRRQKDAEGICDIPADGPVGQHDARQRCPARKSRPR